MDSSTLSPTLTSRRPTDFRVCYDDDDSSGSTRRPWGVAPIDFNYSIEIDVPSELLTDMEKEAILTSISAAVIESVYEDGCFPQRSRKRRRQTVVSRRTEILSISPGSGHEWLGDCYGRVSGNGSFCSEIRGTVEIAFDKMESSSAAASDFESVGNTVLSRIEEDMINGNYVGKVNADMRSFGRVVNSMKYIDSNYPDLVAQDTFSALDWSQTDADLLEADSIGMTQFSKVVIPLMVILSVVAMGLCWFAMKSFPSNALFAKRRRVREEKDLKKKRMKESKYALSLEATLEDLPDVEATKNGGRNSVQSRSFASQRSSISRFMPVIMRPRAQSMPNVVEGSSFQPSDTEAGSSSRSIGQENAPLPSNSEEDFTPIRLLSSFFGKGNAMKNAPVPEPTVMEKISACTGLPTNDCFGDKKNENNNGPMMRYVVPSVERTNSLIDKDDSQSGNISRSQTMPSAERSFMPTMGSKKAAAYKEYINEKILRRNAECDHVDEVEPMEVGVRRTFTDSQGQIREMVAL